MSDKKKELSTDRVIAELKLAVEESSILFAEHYELLTAKQIEVLRKDLKKRKRSLRGGLK